MKILALLLIHVLTTMAQRVGPGGTKAIIAESVLVKHQQLIARRSVGKAPRLTTSDRFLCGFLVLFMHPRRIQKVAVVLKPATLAKHYLPEPYDGGPSWLTFFRHTSESLWIIALFQRKSILPNIPSSLLAIGLCTRRIIICGIASCHFDQTVFCSLFTAGIPVVEASTSLSPAHDPPFSHHRYRRKLFDVGRTQTLAIFPRAPPFTELRIGTRRRNHHDYRSDCGAIDLETEHEALNNNHNLFLMPGPLDEIRSSKISRETAIGHAKSQNFARKRYIREEPRTLIAA